MIPVGTGVGDISRGLRKGLMMKDCVPLAMKLSPGGRAEGAGMDFSQREHMEKCRDDQAGLGVGRHWGWVIQFSLGGGGTRGMW